MEKRSTIFSAKFAQCGQGSGNFVWTKWYSVLASWSYWGLLNHLELRQATWIKGCVLPLRWQWCVSVSQYTGVDPWVYMMAGKMRNRVWEATVVTSQDSKGMCLYLVKFYLITWLPDGDNFTPFNSPSWEWLSSWDDTAIRFGSFSLGFWIDYSVQYNQMQSVHGLFLAVFQLLYKLVGNEWFQSSRSLTSL